MKQTILGSNGYIGSALKEHLQLNGHEVVTPSIDELFSSNGNWGHVYYCVGLTADFRKKPFATVEAHVTIISKILEHANFESLIYLSSTRVYNESLVSKEDTKLLVDVNNPSNLYNLTKLTGESICLSSGRPNIKIVRLSNVVGKSVNPDTLVGELVLQGLSGSINLISNINSYKDYISIFDIVELLPKILAKGQFNLYNVASGLTLSTKSIIGEIGKYFEFELINDSLASPEVYSGIDIDLISKEFNFVPRSSLSEIELLVKNLKEVKANE